MNWEHKVHVKLGRIVFFLLLAFTFTTAVNAAERNVTLGLQYDYNDGNGQGDLKDGDAGTRAFGFTIDPALTPNQSSPEVPPPPSGFTFYVHFTRLVAGNKNWRQDFVTEKDSETWEMNIKLPDSGASTVEVNFPTAAFEDFGNLELYNNQNQTTQTLLDKAGDSTVVLDLEEGTYLINATKITAGSLTVNCVDTSGATVPGLVWSNDAGLTWNASGAIISEVALGSGTVTFQDINSNVYTPPADIPYNMTLDGVSLTGVYTRLVGNVAVKYNSTANFPASEYPDGYLDDYPDNLPADIGSVTWKLWDIANEEYVVDGASKSDFYGTYNGSEFATILTNVPTGDYRIEVKPAEYSTLWISPANQIISITPEDYDLTGANAPIAEFELKEATIEVDKDSLTLVAGDTATVSVTLDEVPTGDVVVTIAESPINQGDSLTFTTGDSYPITKTFNLTVPGGATSSTDPIRLSVAAPTEDPRYTAYEGTTVDGTYTTTTIDIATTIYPTMVDDGSLVISPATGIDFGPNEVTTGEVITRYVIITNTTETDKQFDVTTTGDASFVTDITDNEYYIAGVISLPGNTSTSVAVEFAPNAEMVYNESLLLISESQTPLKSAALIGEGVVIPENAVFSYITTDPEVTVVDPAEKDGSNIVAGVEVAVVLETESIVDPVNYTLTTTITLPTEMTNITFTPGAFDPTAMLAGNTITITSQTVDVTNPEVVLFTVNADVDASTADIITDITFTGTAASEGTAYSAAGQLVISDLVQLANLDVDDNGIVNYNDTVFIFRYVNAYLAVPEAFRTPDMVVESDGELPPGGITKQDVVDNIASYIDGYDVDENDIINYNDTVFIFRYVNAYLAVPEAFRTPDMVVESDGELPPNGITKQDVVDNIEEIY